MEGVRIRKFQRRFDCEDCQRCGCRVCVMKIVTWNVRGLGGFEKRREVRSLVEEKKLTVVCVQETKLVVDVIFSSI